MSRAKSSAFLFIHGLFRRFESCIFVDIFSQHLHYSVRYHFEGELIVSGTAVKNVSYSYLTGKNQAAGFVFVADKNKFIEVCQPIVSEVVDSVVVN